MTKETLNLYKPSFSHKDGYMELNLKGKVNNLPPFKDQALLPVFEAIINSIHAIEDREKGRGTITVKIIRDNATPENFETADDISGTQKIPEKKEKLPEIIDFIIEDNGIGFTNENFESFNISDSTYKESRGGKGIGRFSWLKAFEKVEIESVYEDGSGKKLRRFVFSTKKRTGIEELNNESTDLDVLTRVKLLKFKKGYRDNPSAYKKTSTIAQRILEHFLSYYIHEIIPEIIIEDGDIRVNLDEYYSEIKNNIYPELIDIRGQAFTIYHVELPHTKKDLHQIVYCADGRDVSTTSINNLLGTSAFSKNGQKIYYAAYVVSEYLTGHVDSLRRGFDFPKNDYQGIDGNYEISKETLEREIINHIKNYLSEYLSEVKKKKEEQVLKIVSENPILRNIPHYYSDVYDEIKPSDNDKQVMEILYKRKAQDSYKTRQDYDKLLKTQLDSYEEIKEKCKEITSQLERNEKDNLAEYVIWRKLIIELLDNKLKSNKLQKYQKEKIIHDLIFPRKTTTDQLDIDNINLWLIDDQLIFHEFAASDKQIKEVPFVDSESELRPDIIIFSKGDNNQNSEEISIFELKRPMLGSVPKDPISYMYDIIEEITQNRKKREDGRLLRSNSNTRFYCYAVCDITGDIETIKRNHKMRELNQNFGYYTYHPDLKAHIYILSFDELIKNAKRRNAMFLNKLGTSF